MSENSLPPRPKPLACGAAQPVQRPPVVAMKYTEESSPMCLGVAMGYFSSCLPREFCVNEGVYSPKGSEGVVKGDIFIACLTKQESFLKIRSAVSAPGNDSVTVPVVTRTEFALMPPSEEGNETDAAIRNWEGTFHSVTEFFEARSEHQSMPMPAALNVLDNALDHNGQKVPAKTILFNIRQVSQRVGLRKRCGIEGVDCSGVVHRFLEGEDPVYFSTKLFDVKCLPMCFKNVLQLPQTARVYLHPNAEEEEEEVNLLQNLSTVTITEVSHGHHLVVRKLSDDGNHLGPAFAVPLTADLKVVAIKLKDSHLLDDISDQRCIVRAKSSPSIGPTDSPADMYINPYSDDPGEATRGDIQAGRKEDRDKEAYYNADTSRLKQHHKYDNVQVAVAFVPSHVSTGSTAAAATDQYYVMMDDTELDDVSDVYEYMEDSKLISSVTPRGKKLPLRPGNSTQPLAVPLKRLKNWKDSGVRSLGNSPVTPARKGDSHRLPCSDWRKGRSMPGRGIDAHPSDQELFHHVARKLGADWKCFALYLGCEHTHTEQADREQSLENKAFDILVAWRKGTGNKPKSWATILKALEDAGRMDLVHEIQRHIEGGTLYSSTSQVK